MQQEPAARIMSCATNPAAVATERLAGFGPGRSPMTARHPAPDPGSLLASVLAEIEAHGDPRNVEGMARYGG
jgi:hypothetical protein